MGVKDYYFADKVVIMFICVTS